MEHSLRSLLFDSLATERCPLGAPENPGIMTRSEPHKTGYVAWQNRATRFYVAARSCYLSRLYAPAAYCAVIALEILVKATLVYHDKAFNPRHFHHNIAKLRRALGNKVPRSEDVTLPSYFWHEDRYLTATRYPSDGHGIGVPGSFLTDLDCAFAGLLYLTPFQHNTELKRILASPSGTERQALIRQNAQARRLRLFLKVPAVRGTRTGA